jgi:hypothetical protein
VGDVGEKKVHGEMIIAAKAFMQLFLIVLYLSVDKSYLILKASAQTVMPLCGDNSVQLVQRNDQGFMGLLLMQSLHPFKNYKEELKG